MKHSLLIALVITTALQARFQEEAGEAPRRFVPPSEAPSIERVRIGLPAGRGGFNAGKSRNAVWTPVAITLKAGSHGVPANTYRLRVETADSEELRYHYPVEVPAMEAGTEQTVQGYAAFGSDDTSCQVRLETTEGQWIQAKSQAARDPVGIVRDQDLLFLALGTSFSSLKRAAEKPEAADKAQGVDAESETGRRQFAFVEDVEAMPDRWFGYGGVDVVVLSTRDPQFVARLAQDSMSARRTALLDWVRRGGQLVLTIGSSRREVSRELLPRLPLVDAKVTGSETLKAFPALSLQWCKMGVQKAPLLNMEVTTLELGNGVHVLVREGDRPILLETSCGLGRVIVTAFDLEDPKFTNWDGQLSFWTKLQQEISPLVAPRGAKAVEGVRWGENEERDDLRDQLRANLEAFEEITPISFGWVALFIVLYIILVGPLDYFILKKVFKRLEWTWLTFPIAVVGASVLAYVAAYSVKGEELRTNKIDLIDIDLHQPQESKDPNQPEHRGNTHRSSQLYGHTWFTLFSPRMGAYTIGLHPAVDSWTDKVETGTLEPTFHLLETGVRPRTGAQGMFAKPFEFAFDASSVRDVPIPVWSTRSFGVSWRAPLPRKAWLDITDDGGTIRKAREGKGLVGKLTNRLAGVEWTGVCLFYRDRWYSLGSIAPGESRRLEPLFAADAQGQGKKIAEWFNDPTQPLAPGLPLNPTGRPINAKFEMGRNGYSLMKTLLFFRATEKPIRSNVGLRDLDQTWRAVSRPEFPPPINPRYRDEAILIARTRLLCDRAEAVSVHPASPSRLWLGAVPSESGERPTMPGILTQETYLRAFIPVAD